MKLATRRNGTRDGELVVVDRELVRCYGVPDIAATLQQALDAWPEYEPRLREVYAALNAGTLEGEPFEQAACHSPLPRAYHWADGSAYINHVELVRRARGAAVPDTFYVDPLMYQGGSDSFAGPRDPILALSQDWGIDLEAEVAVITGDVPMGASEATAMAAIRLVMLVNDVSLRNLIPEELAKGFGFYQSKPATAFSPVAVTPDELAPFWFGDKLQRALHVSINGRPFGRPDAGTDMAFGFGQLIAHAAKTRELGAGTIIGSGTVSNKTESLSTASIENGGVGFCCISELRMVETIQTGKPQTPYLAFGDRVRIEMFDRAGYSIFGAIDQEVAHYSLRQSTRRGTAV